MEKQRCLRWQHATRGIEAQDVLLLARKSRRRRMGTGIAADQNLFLFYPNSGGVSTPTPDK